MQTLMDDSDIRAMEAILTQVERRLGGLEGIAEFCIEMGLHFASLASRP